MMSKSEAQKVLSQNVLTLDNDGLQELPLRTIEVDMYKITPTDEDFPAKILGLISLVEPRNSELSCSSFIVKYQRQYYYRYFLFEAFKVIEALRVMNDYQVKQSSESIVYC